MPYITLATLITESRLYADMNLDSDGGNSTPVTDANILVFLQNAVNALWDIVTASQNSQYIKSSTITCSGLDTIDLPQDFQMLRGVDEKSGSDYHTLSSFTFPERNHYRNSYWGSLFRNSSDYQYMLEGNTLFPRLQLQPTPANGVEMRVWYVPEAPDLSSVGSIEVESRWREYLTVSAAIECKEMEETDTSKMRKRLYFLMRDITASATRRDLSAPQRMHIIDNWRR